MLYLLMDRNISIVSHLHSIQQNAISLVIQRLWYWLGRGGLLWSNHWHESSSRKLDEHPRTMYDMPWNKSLCREQSGYKLLTYDIRVDQCRKLFLRCNFLVEWASASNYSPTNQIWENLVNQININYMYQIYQGNPVAIKKISAVGFDREIKLVTRLSIIIINIHKSIINSIKLVKLLPLWIEELIYAAIQKHKKFRY